MDLSALGVWAVTGAISALGLWCAWLTNRQNSQATDMDNKLDIERHERHALDKRVTVQETKDYPDYRQLMEILDPIKEKVDAIAVQVGANPDRRGE